MRTEREIREEIQTLERIVIGTITTEQSSERWRMKTRSACLRRIALLRWVLGETEDAPSRDLMP